VTPPPSPTAGSTVVDGVHYHQHDVVIVGAGGAGMRAAIQAGPGASTAVISKITKNTNKNKNTKKPKQKKTIK